MLDNEPEFLDSNFSLDNLAIKNIIIPENLLGEGHSKLCYKIPDMPDFCLAIIKDIFNPDLPIKPFFLKEDIFNNLNFGQTIAVSPSGLKLMKRLSGEPHGIKGRINKTIAYKLGENLPVNEAVDFYNQIRSIASFPFDSYKFLAYQLKVLGENDIRVDAINPNNILVDNDKKQFHIIDFEVDLDDSDICRNVVDYPRPLNGVHDMHCLLLDAHLHHVYLKIIPVELYNDFIETSKLILKKCNDAADAVNLNKGYDCTIMNMKKVSDMLPEQKIYEYYLLFAKLYDNELKII